jgi:hypothetical protein
MPYLFGMVISLLLPFVVFTLWWQAFAWWLQRVPPNSKAMERAQKLGPAPPPVKLVDAKGNVRHEWAADLVQQRLRGIEVPRAE